MIIFFTKGRLGNEIFQHSFANNISNPNELILTNNCNYFQLFDNNPSKYLILSENQLILVKAFLKIFLALKFITRITPICKIINGKSTETSSLNVSKGFFHNIKYVEGFYQSEYFLGVLPKIKLNIVNEANDFLKKLESDFIKIFVHIREGDYNSFKIFNKSVKLEDNYFFEGIKFFEEKYNNVLFLFISDDINKTKNRFNCVKNSVFVSKSINFDFTLMTLCDGGVISNSTFSWWGAYLIDNPLDVIAPKYWLGRNIKQWYPIDINTKKFQFI